MSKIPRVKINKDWNKYYRNKSNKVPRDTLLKALEFFKSEKDSGKQFFAIDIGCGHGADTIELLKRGWKVLAIDNNAKGLSILKESILPDWKKNLKISRQPFEDIRLSKCNLLNAGYSIPFCKPEYFQKLWDKIVKSIISNGRFSGNFFGNKDSWANNKDMTFQKINEVKNLFNKFEIENWEERDEDGFTAIGESKHWHVFNVVARKL